MHGLADKRRSGLIVEGRAIVRLAAPVAIAQLGMMALGMVDVMMVGHLSRTALAAVALGHAYTFGLMILGMGTLFVLDPLVSQAFGAGDVRGVALALQRGIVLAMALAVPFGILFHTTRPLLSLIAGDAEVVPTAFAYTRVIAYGLPAFFTFIVFRQTLQAMSIVRPVMIAVVLGNLANVVLNLALVYGRFGCPALGAVGSAWATTCCRYFMAAALIAAGSGAVRRIWRPPTRELLRPAPYLPMLVKGVQIGLQIALEVWVFLTVSFLCVRMGVVAMGGHAVAMNLASISFMVPIGVGAAAATRTGNAIGRGDPAGARRAARTALLLGAAVMLVSATLFLAAPETLARLYSGDPEVIAMGAALLPIAGLFQVFDGTQAVACGVLRGAGETRLPMVINLVGYWGIGLPVGIGLAFGAGMGPRGLWWGLTAGLSVCAGLLVAAVFGRVGAEHGMAAAPPAQNREQ